MPSVPRGELPDGQPIRPRSGPTHNADDFRPPFTERVIREPIFQPNTIIPSYHSDSISACVSSAQALFDNFVTYTPDELHCIPVFMFARVGYAIMVLMRIWVTAAIPDSEMGSIVHKEELRVDYCISRPPRARSQMWRNRPAEKFAMIFVMMRSWYASCRRNWMGGMRMIPRSQFGYAITRAC